jgi:hypothetical protein
MVVQTETRKADLMVEWLAGRMGHQRAGLRAHCSAVQRVRWLVDQWADRRVHRRAEKKAEK